MFFYIMTITLMPYIFTSIGISKLATGLMPRKDAVNAVTMFLPYTVALFLIALISLLGNILHILPEALSESFLFMLGLSAALGVSLYLFFVEYPFWLGRKRWKKNELKRLEKKCTSLLRSLNEFRISKAKPSRMNGTILANLERANLELELARHERSKIEVIRSASHPYNLPIAALTVTSYSLLALLLEPFMKYILSAFIAFG